MYRLMLLTLAVLLWQAVPALAAEDQDRAWPVGVRPAVVRGWEPPPSRYAAGHRGVDLAAEPGAPVRAAAAGKVSFAGRVAGRGVLSVTLPGTGDPPLRTTYEPVRTLVTEGEEVRAGQVVAVLEPGAYHCPAGGCLHWGLLRGADYLDPLSLLPPGLLHRGPPRLLPVFGVPLPAAAVRDGALPVAVLAGPVWWLGRRGGWGVSPGRRAGPSRRRRR